MAAELIVTYLWKRRGQSADWDAALAAARTLTLQEAVDITASAGMEQGGWDEDQTIAEGVTYAVECVEVLKGAFDEGELMDIPSPDGQWACWLTGGTSCGDSPPAPFNEIHDLAEGAPRVLAAAGFNVSFNVQEGA